jgi:hypothetical protein
MRRSGVIERECAVDARCDLARGEPLQDVVAVHARSSGVAV